MLSGWQRSGAGGRLGRAQGAQGAGAGGGRGGGAGAGAGGGGRRGEGYIVQLSAVIVLRWTGCSLMQLDATEQTKH